MRSNLLRYLAIVLGLAALVWALWYFKAIVIYILVAAIISLIGAPLVKILDRIKIGKKNFPRALSAAITLALILFMIFIFFRLFIPMIAYEAHEFSNIDITQVKENLREPLGKIQEWIGTIETENGTQLSVEDYVSNKVVSILSLSRISNVLGFITGMLGDIFIGIFSISFITFFFLKDTRLASRSVLLLIPDKFEESTRHALTSIKNLLTRYFLGLIIQLTLIMLLISLGLYLVGLDFQHAIIIGLFAGLFNVVPYVGPIIGGIFGIVIGIVTNINLDFYAEILPLIGYIALVFVSVQLIDNFIFQPFIYSSSVKAHPLEIFLVILIAGSVAGIKGMILAIPTYTVLRAIAKEFFNKFKVVKKLTENI